MVTPRTCTESGFNGERERVEALEGTLPLAFGGRRVVDGVLSIR